MQNELIQPIVCGGFMAILIKCKTCGKQVSKTAPTCPYCGENAPGINISCPVCTSKNFSTGQKGFGLGKAAAGAVLLGPVGLLGGLLGRKKIEFICQSCGHKWKPDPREF
jgi:DNA-directed RNA polymerase subunit RPC12/RpoP